jgi:hypothetical protein
MSFICFLLLDGRRIEAHEFAYRRASSNQLDRRVPLAAHLPYYHFVGAGDKTRTKISAPWNCATTLMRAPSATG